MVKGKEHEHRPNWRSPLEKGEPKNFQTCSNCGMLFESGDVECPRCHVKPSVYARRFEKFTRSE